MASSSSKHSQKHAGSKSLETEEIVRYMSNLPSYLERGKPVQDRALSFGVLDWGRLEQWQYLHHKQTDITANKLSLSSSNLSNRSSLHSHLNISFEESSTKDHIREKKTTNRPRTRARGPKKNNSHDSHPQDLVESKSSDDMGSFHTTTSSSSSKGKMKSQDETCDGTYHSDTKRDTPNAFPFKNEISSRKNSKYEDSKIKAKVKMDLGNCKEVRVDNSCKNKTNDSSSSRKRAHFQMAVKNGRPLFTFSIDDNNKEILAATVRSLTGKDDTNSWIYTFFTIQEVKKKKSGWLYHSSKDKGNEYLPNVTAQMTVSNPTVSNCTAREFVLSSVDSGQADHQNLDVELENELAAIVVRFLRKSGEDENQDCFSATVILPGGHHSVPRKGEPSPLIERWRSGGRCDCGGWDVGCRLRTFTNKVQSNRRSNSPESFDLFLQGDVINERPFFSLSPIKEGIFSVDYNASFSLLHAFSICISVIECRKSSHQTEVKTYVAKRVDDDMASVTYASLPPVSPVGRV